VARRPEHHRGALGAAPVGVGGGISLPGVGLNLGEPHSDEALGRPVLQHAAEQVLGDHDGGTIEEGTGQRPRRAGGRLLAGGGLG